MNKHDLDETDKKALAAMQGSLTSSLFLFCLHLIKVFLLALLDGALLFIVAAAVFGFFAWLCGASDPRSVAVSAGVICGIGAVMIKMLLEFARIIRAFQDR